MPCTAFVSVKDCRIMPRCTGGWRQIRSFCNATSMFDLRDVVNYIVKRVGLIPGRVWFGAAAAINVNLTAGQRRNFLSRLLALKASRAASRLS